MADERYRNFATVIYPESAPENWQDIIADLCIPCFISPLHDSDINPTGENKKEHRHVMFMFEGKKSKEQVKKIFDSFGGVGCEVIGSIRGYARYLCHLDNPEKHQYSISDVLMFGGADYLHIIGLASDKYKGVREMIEFINTNGILHFADMLEYCSVHRPDWFKLLCDNSAYIVKEYIFSYNRKVSQFNLPDDNEEV